MRLSASGYFGVAIGASRKENRRECLSECLDYEVLLGKARQENSRYLVKAVLYLNCTQIPVMQNFGTGAVTPPWVVNLDHALLKSNIDHERAIAVIGQEIFSFPSRIKSIIASGEFKIEKRPMDASALAYNQDVLDALKREYRNGRKLFLCSALPYSVVKAVCDYHGIFSGFFVLDAASQNERDGVRRSIAQEFGSIIDDFELISLPADIGALTAAGHGSGQSGALVWTNVLSIISAIRVRQWSKNVLVFVPVMVSPVSTTENWYQSILAFLAFSLVASISYVCNDLLDLQADRAHPTKRLRPFASGALPVATALFLVPILLVAACVAAFPLALTFQMTLVLYFMLTCLYSIYLKRMLMIDVVVLGCLYAIRVAAGGEATGIRPSEWLIAFSVFFFLALALIKRQAELATMLKLRRTKAGNRSYRTEDFPVIAALASSAAFNAVTIYAVFVWFEVQNELYSTPEALWFAIPMLVYWLGRMVLLAHRGSMLEDPIVFGATDAKSLICGAVVFGIVQWAH
ncbi:UbiA family prenyltransferase [Ensifer aridi]|uniref:UbiA family prenyltransferase n=2 Tax=Ensifer aridi TaxID=1708715 RepID=UPI001554A650|nr:UbiA family prenyltransferase [Ensifer aridi]